MKTDSVVQVAFHVFYTKARGPFLSYCLVPNGFAPQNFSDQAGAQFGSTRELEEALSRVGLSSTVLDGTPCAASIAQLEELGIEGEN
jgi:hypothetical protein